MTGTLVTLGFYGLLYLGIVHTVRPLLSSLVDWVDRKMD